MNMTLFILFYWAVGIICAILFLGDELFPEKTTSTDRSTSIKRNFLFLVSLLVVAANIYVYYNSTSNGGRPFDVMSMIIFAVLNGSCETFVFLAIFKLGENMMRNFTDKSPYLFLGGI